MKDARATDNLKGNTNFMVSMGLLVLAPPAIAYFGPVVLGNLSDIQWLGITAGVAVLLLFLADETFVPGGRNLSTGVTQPGEFAHRLLTNPLFDLLVAVIAVGPAATAFFAPDVIPGPPAWIWLVAGWIMGALATWGAYRTLVSIQSAP